MKVNEPYFQCVYIILCWVAGLKYVKKSYIDRISGLKDVNFKKENILNACWSVIQDLKNTIDNFIYTLWICRT